MRINVLDLSRFCCAVGPFRLVFLSDLPSLSLPPPFPSSFHRWTRHFASFDTEGERGEEQPSWKYSFPLSRAPRVFFFSKSLPSFPFLFPPPLSLPPVLLFLLSSLPFRSKSSFDGVARGRMILRCFEGGTMKILIDGDCVVVGELLRERDRERERNNNNERPIDFVSNKNFIDQGTSVKF